MVVSDIRKYSFKQGLPQEFELVSIGQLFNNHTNKLITPHRTGFYHILWFQKGKPTHLVDFHPVKVKSNSILFIPQDSVQRFDNKGEFDGQAILFTDSFFSKTEQDAKFLRSSIVFNDLFSVSQIDLSKSSDKVFSDLFQQIETELKNEKDVFQSDILRNFLHSLLLLSERERRKQHFTEIKTSPDLDYVLLFREQIEKQFKTSKQVSYYARELRVTEKRLNKATSKVLDKTPKQMIDERIMLEAKRLLVHSNESIKEISYILGFEEPTNFIKYFKKHQGSTPFEFREISAF